MTESKWFSLTKCTGQGYDGARTMSRIYADVQKRILAKQPKAVYVHCAAHNLNWVVNDAVCGLKQTSSLFCTLEELYIFFGHSIRKWKIISSITGESDTTLRKLNLTSFTGRLASIMGVNYTTQTWRKHCLRSCFFNANKDEREEAVRIKKSLARYEFVLLVEIMSRKLSEITLLHSIWNARIRTMKMAVDHLSSASLNLSNYRSQFVEVNNEAINVCAKWRWGVPAKLEQKRISKNKKTFGRTYPKTNLSRRFIPRQRL